MPHDDREVDDAEARQRADDILDGEPADAAAGSEWHILAQVAALHQQIPMDLTPGTRLGPYEILAPIGAGGMGDAYRARRLMGLVQDSSGA